MCKKSRIIRILILALWLPVLASCSGVKDIRITSCSIMSLTPNGLKSLGAVLALGIDNPIMAFDIQDLAVEVMRGESSFATFSAGELPVERKCTKVYPLSCSGAIDRSVPLMELLKLAATKDFSDFTVNMQARIKLKCGLGARLRFKNIKITDLISPEVAAAYLDQINDALI